MSALYSHPQSSNPGDPKAILEAQDLVKHFPLRQANPLGPRHAVRAVEDVSLALYPGHATALVGESGSGKSTVARILARLYEPTGGTLRFRGDQVKLQGGAALRSYRRHVQLVFQDPFSSLNPVHDIRYHLSRPLHIHGHIRSGEQEHEQILSLLNRVSLTPADQF